MAHFDIKPENVLYIGLNESYILADFGISEHISTTANWKEELMQIKK